MPGGRLRPKRRSYGEVLNYTEYLDQAWVYLAQHGVPYDDYWHGSPRLTMMWRKAVTEDRLRKLEDTNFLLHHLGGYIYNAVSASLSEMMWCMNGGKGEKPEGYVTHVIPVTQREEDADLERRKKETLDWVRKGQT